LISFLISPKPHWSLSNVLFILQLFVYFLLLLLLLNSSFIALWQYPGVFQFSYICWEFLCALRYDLFWRKFHVCWEECILCCCRMECSVESCQFH
jgi:hypothetical protein